MGTGPNCTVQLGDRPKLHIMEVYMEFGFEVKFLGDGYCGGFSNGLTMAGSDSVRRFKESGDGSFEDGLGHVIYVVSEADTEATRVHTEFQNNSDSEVTLELLSSFALKGVKTRRIYRLQSFWSAEGKLRVETIEDLHLEKSWSGHGVRCEKFGTVGSMPVRKFFPFLAVENSETGEFTGILMGNAASWQMELICRETTELEITGGIADKDYGQWMKKVAPGERFVTPDALIARGKSIEEVCDKLVKAWHPDISPVDSDMGIIFNEYCTSWGNPDAANIKRLADKLAGREIKYLVIDAGWYGLPDDWVESVGNWEVNADRFPEGLKGAADYIRSKGMIPGLWFEMETIGPHCKYYDKTDLLLKKDGYPLTVGDRRFLDMENPLVLEHLAKDVIGTLKDGGFGYIKIDYNDTIGAGCDGGDSLGEALYRKVEATRNFIRRIREEIPGIVIEICSSGGHRLVYSMLELASQASFSDAHETVAIPIIAANVHRIMPPCQSQIWSVLRAGDDVNRLHYSLAATFLGRMCLSGDIYDLTNEQMAVVDEAMTFYRKAADIIKYGKTTRIECTATSYNDPVGHQIVEREYEGRKLVVIHKFRGDEAGLELPTKAIASFGALDGDFSACAYLISCQ